MPPPGITRSGSIWRAARWTAGASTATAAATDKQWTTRMEVLLLEGESIVYLIAGQRRGAASGVGTRPSASAGIRILIEPRRPEFRLQCHVPARFRPPIRRADAV